jgi:hypothetical protein
MDKETPVRDSQTKAIELEERLVDFAVRIVRLTAHLPKTPAGKLLPDKSSDPELLRRQIMVRPEERKVTPILFTRLGSF